MIVGKVKYVCLDCNEWLAIASNGKTVNFKDRPDAFLSILETDLVAAQNEDFPISLLLKYALVTAGNYWRELALEHCSENTSWDNQLKESFRLIMKNGRSQAYRHKAKRLYFRE